MADAIVTRDAWLDQVIEPPLEPDLPIVDPHHHLWPVVTYPGFGAYDLDAALADKTAAGHNIVATVLVEAHSQYRTDGPEHLRSVGETEMADRAGREADRRAGRAAGLCAGIVPHADMLLGDAVEEVLLAHLAASDRVRGVRCLTAYDRDYDSGASAGPGLLADPRFRSATRQLAKHGLSLDVWPMQSQLAEVAALARHSPDVTIILDHLGGPMGIGRFAADAEGGFAEWKAGMALVAQCPKVVVKLGGLNMEFVTRLCPSPDSARPWTSEHTAAVQRRHILTAIELFGPSRCMFESNFPVDRLVINAGLLWNGFKRVVADFSADEKRQLFCETAIRTYRLDGSVKGMADGGAAC